MMAECTLSQIEFIHSTFAPVVGVLTSPDAEKLSRKNNLSFVQLLGPFARLHAETHIRDPVGQPVIVRNFRLQMVDASLGDSRNPSISRKHLNDIVQNVIADRDPETLASGNRIITPWYEAYREAFINLLPISDHEFTRHAIACLLVVSTNNPDPIAEFKHLIDDHNDLQYQTSRGRIKWFMPTVYRHFVLLHDISEGDSSRLEVFNAKMKSMFGSTACHVLQINSRPQDKVDELIAYCRSGAPQPADPWAQFVTNYKPVVRETAETQRDDLVNDVIPVVVHEAAMGTSIPASTSIDNFSEVSIAIDDVIKEQQDSQNDASNLVVDHPLSGAADIQSNGLTDPVATTTDEVSFPRGVYLTLMDHDRLRLFAYEFIVRGLLPFMERQIKFLHDQTFAKKGIRGSLFNATKKWFGGNKPMPNNTSLISSNIYAPESPELQMRRLADLCFLCQEYELAYSVYHTLKREFGNDHSWLFLAGSLEMCSLSSFLQGGATPTQRHFPSHYLDTAVNTYHNVCKNPDYATRATLLGSECLKHQGLYSECAMIFIKMTSEDSDLRSALLLEQAAICFLLNKVPMVRKYAFHMILAGHRFSKAGQRRHTLRTYAMASDIFHGKQWQFAEDHINFTIGRQNFNLKYLDNSCKSFARLLTPQSKQNPSQQSTFLREYLFVYRLLSQGDGGFPLLSLPVIHSDSTRVYLTHSAAGIWDATQSDGHTAAALWETMELEAAQFRSGMAVKPSRCFFSSATDNSARPVSVVGEPIYIEVTVVNPLKVPLSLHRVSLLWEFTPINYPKERGDNEEILPSFDNEASTPRRLDGFVSTEVISEVILGDSETKSLIISLTPHKTGRVHIQSIIYSLAGSSIISPITSTITPSASTSGDSVPSSIAASTVATPNTDRITASFSATSSATNSSGTASTMTTAASTGDSSTSPPSASRPVAAAPAVSTENLLSVRGKQHLSVVGKRLNATLDQRINRVYSSDFRFHVEVTRPMPLLHVNITSLPRTMMSGEVRRVAMELANHGCRPLTNLCLGFSDPEYFHLSVDPSGSELSQTVYPVVSPDINRTSFHVKLSANQSHRYVIIPLPGGQLDPGESHNLPLWLRGPLSAGRHAFQLLFYYESTDWNAKLTHRVLRHSVAMETMPMLNLTAEASSRKADRLILSLQVTNTCELKSVGDLTVMQVCGISNQYSIRKLRDQTAPQQSINPKETICLNLEGLQVNPERQTLLTNVVFGSVQVDSSRSPCLDFYKHFVNKKSDQSTEPTSGRLDLSVIVIWRAVVVKETGFREIITGQHHLAIPELAQSWSTFRDGSAVEEPPMKLFVSYTKDEPRSNPGRVIHYVLSHPTVTRHNFAIHPVFLQTVKVSLFNYSDDVALLDITTSKNDDSNIKLYDADSCWNTLIWVGQSWFQLQIQPKCSRIVELTAAILAPGSYTVTGIEVQLIVNGSESIIQSPPSITIMVVEDMPV